MKISYQWLQKYFDTPLPPAEQIADALTFHAFELESVEQAGDDAVLDVKITPNRGHDALSHRGIAKELSAILGIPLANDPLGRTPALAPLTQKLAISIGTPGCARYSAALLSGVVVKESPAWLKRRLEAVGQRSINNVVDATNFVMFNLGQPLHAFDADKLLKENGTHGIEVRSARDGESIEALDGKTYELRQGMIVIGDAHAKKAIGIAGVKGGRAAEIGKETHNIVLESANFDGASVRKTAKNLKLRTDASARFEHGLSPELAPYALASVVELILKLAGGACEGYADSYLAPLSQPPVQVSLSRVNALLGVTLHAGQVERLLTRLGLPFIRKDELFTVTPPLERLDLNTPEDLVEEIGRLHGYEHVPLRAPSGESPIRINKRFFYAERVRTCLIQEGFSEVLTSSFRNTDEVQLENALASDKGFLRSSLSPNLEDALALNERSLPVLGLTDVRLFELGTVFSKKGEHLSLAFGLSGKKAGEWLAATKMKLEEALGPIALGTGTVSSNVYEFDFDALVDKLPEPQAYEGRTPTVRIKYQPFSSYPFVLRDIALWTPKGTPSSAVEDILREEGGDLLVRIRLFDTFEKGEKTSYAFNLIFQAKNRTLTDEEVGSIMDGVSKALVGEAGFEVR